MRFDQNIESALGRKGITNVRELFHLQLHGLTIPELEGCMTFHALVQNESEQKVMHAIPERISPRSFLASTNAFWTASNEGTLSTAAFTDWHSG